MLVWNPQIIWKDVIHTFYKAEIFTVAATLKVLACATWKFGDFLGLGLHQMSYIE